MNVANIKQNIAKNALKPVVNAPNNADKWSLQLFETSCRIIGSHQQHPKSKNDKQILSAITYSILIVITCFKNNNREKQRQTNCLRYRPDSR